MSSSRRERILPICRSAVALCGAVLSVASLAAIASLLSSRGEGSLADFVSAICSPRFQSASQAEAPYIAENVSAMTKMMFDMGIRPSGDIDGDFVAMMTPHHQGAIEMALAELRYGHNERLKRMAQEIIVTQRDEIAAMRQAIGLPPSVPADVARTVTQTDPEPTSSPFQEQ